MPCHSEQRTVRLGDNAKLIDPVGIFVGDLAASGRPVRGRVRDGPKPSAPISLLSTSRDYITRASVGIRRSPALVAQLADRPTVKTTAVLMAAGSGAGSSADCSHSTKP